VKENQTPNEVSDLQESIEETADQTAEPAEKDTPDEVAALKAELEESKAKADEYYAQLQRLKAEFDNFRKRTQKEKEDAAKYSSEKIIGSLLPVLDNFERAVDSCRNTKDFASLSQGVEMILRQFLKVLEDEGLKAIAAKGQQFDPNLHEALLREETEQAENMILEELQKGYYLKDKVLRPSRVKVSG
jgi:molecular chaperone GrpE